MRIVTNCAILGLVGSDPRTPGSSSRLEGSHQMKVALVYTSETDLLYYRVYILTVVKFKEIV